MPPRSEAQRRLMQAAANDPKLAKRLGIPVTVAKEFAASDPSGKLPAGGQYRLKKEGKKR